MAGEGIHIPVDADDKQLRQLATSLRKVNQEAIAAAKALRSANAAAQGAAGGHGGSGGGGGAGGGVPHPTAHRGGILHALARVTRGTDLGHFAHLGSAVQGIGTAGAGMLAFGAAAAVGTLAMKAFAEFSNRAVEAAKREAEMRIELTHAMRDAVKAADTKAIGAFGSNREALLSLAGMGGDQMVDAAKRFGTQVGPEGIKAYATIAGTSGGFKESNLEGARLASSTGLISIDKAAAAIASGKVRSGMDPMGQAAAILSQETGQRITTADVKEMAANLAGSKIGGAAQRFEAGEGRITAAGIDRFVSSQPSIAAAQGKEVGELASPTTAAVLELNKKMDEQLEVLKAGADAQWRIVRWFEHSMGTYGLGSGSMRDQYDRARAASAP